MQGPCPPRHRWLAGLLEEALGAHGVEVELQRLQWAGVLPAGIPLPQSWPEALATLPPAACAALILRVRPAEDPTDETAFLDRVVAARGRSGEPGDAALGAGRGAPLRRGT